MKENIPVDVLNKTSNKSVSEEVPFEVVPLPSQGLLYDEDHPLYKETTVEIKAMTAAEEDILTSPALIKKGTVADELIKACLINKLIDPETLYPADKDSILLAIRISGFGGDYTVKTECPACEKDFEHTFNLGVCEIKKLEDPKFEFELPKSKKLVKFKLLTSGEQNEIIKSQTERRKAIKKATGNNVQVESNVTDRLARQIVSLGGETDRSKIASFVRTMPAFDSKALRSHIRKMEPSVNMVQEVSCPHCDESKLHDIPMGTEFLWPKLD